MEEKRLNFNTPLISVRRISASGSSSLDSLLPNNRRSIPPYRSAGSNVQQMTEPVNVPFMWEQIPGVAKNHPEPPYPNEVYEKVSVDQAMTELLRSLEGSTKGEGDETESVGFLDDSDDNDHEVQFDSDAPESSSLAESVSFSSDYSVSGLSGSDGSARKPCGMFSVDPTSREFIIGRFLPAARAMAFEPPLFACHKQQPLPYEHPEEVKREPVRDTSALPRKGQSGMIKKYHKHGLGEEDKSQGEIDEADDDYGIIQGKGCGLIPKLSLKGSLCLLNHIPWTKVGTKSSLSVPSPAKRWYKDGLSGAKTTPVSKNDYYKYGSNGGTLTPKIQGRDKLSAGGSRRFNFSGEIQIMKGPLSPFRRSNFSGELQVVRGSLSPFRRSNLSGELQVMRGSLSHFSRSNFSGELQIMRGSSSPFMRSRADALFARQNVDNQKQQSERGSLTPRLPSLRARPPHFNYSGELPERRLHDVLITPRLWDHTVKPPAGGTRCFNLSGELQALRDSVSPYRHSTTAGAFSTRQNERPSSPLVRARLLSSYSEVESITGNSSDESRKDRLLQTSFGVKKVYVDSIDMERDSQTNPKSSKQEVRMEPETKEENETPLRRRARELKEASSERSDPREFLKPPRFSRLSTSGDLTQSKVEKLNGGEKGDLSCQSLPPLLKSPSQSWLDRTRTVPSGGGPFTPKMQSRGMVIPTCETKWENIVRSSNSHHDHIRYLEELMAGPTRKSK
ncbi:hypothetical protein SAY87_024219 [Trapa incisa]|uniref:Uncharacterized protein n=1 Tax=Trapa incisa TaxID=236973 RepID=A0AAN7J8I4_9MYRT|nr:hypothetical protein SAY87_024219 [Trapa incisa]